MILVEDDIREFARIWQAEFNEKLTVEDARSHASQLLELYALLAGVSLKTTGRDGATDSTET